MAVYDPLTGNLLGVMTSQSNNMPSGGAVVADSAAVTSRSKAQSPASRSPWDFWQPTADWFGNLSPEAQRALAPPV
jgi:hypothetical protein